MLPEVDKAGFTPIEIPRTRRNPWAAVKIGAAMLVVGGMVWAWLAGYVPSNLLAGTRAPIEFVEIDQGPVDLYVVDTGSIESAHNTTVRCEVEALMGLVGGTQGATAKGAAAGSSAQGAGGAAGSAQGAGGASGSGTEATTTKSKTAKKTGSSSSSAKSGGTGSTASGSSGSSSSSGSSGSSSGSSGGGSSGSSASSTATTSSSTLTKPVLRSFTYMVTKYIPARPATPKAADTTKKQTDTSQGKGGGGGGGGRGRGGRGGGGGGMGAEEKAGSTRIVEIVAEGSPVKAGDVVARLDSSAYEEEERSQRIRYLQAESYVKQAQSMLEVAEITLREYRDGIYPQDLQLIRQYAESCQIDRDRSSSNLKWSRDMLKLGYRTPFQVRGDFLALEQCEIALKEAQGMYERLSRWTGPKIIKSLQANVAAIKADLLNQEASFSLEKQRLERLRRNIAHCKVTAPGDGLVVYANQADWRGMVTDPIGEGVTLREKQPIFNLPDPQHMRVRARINESKMPLVQTNQKALVVVDAYPAKPLKGIVAEVVPISIPLRGSDVRIYYANVDIVEGFDALRPGLSAEIQIEIDRRDSVTRVPVESIRWIDGKSYVALYDKPRADAGQEPWVWREIEIGLSDPGFAEVIRGLKPGDRVVGRPAGLPAPKNEKIAKSPGTVAAL